VTTTVHDREKSETRRVSVSSAGIQGSADSWAASISADGRYVAFMSDANNLVPNDTNARSDIFVHGSELAIVAEPPVVLSGQTLTLTEYKCVAGNLASLWSVNVNGSSIFLLVAVGSFASDGNYVVSGPVPPGLSGDTITFRGYAYGQSGLVVGTGDVTVSFQ